MRRAIGFITKPTERIYFFTGQDMNVFTKQPNETYTVGIDFAAPGALPDSTSLSSCAATAFETATGASAPSVLATAGSTSGTKAQVRVTGGTAGIDYSIKLLITLSNGDVLEEDLLMQVRAQLS